MAKNINFQTQKLLTWKNTFELPRGMECIQMTKTFLRLQMDVFCHFKFCHDKWNHLVTVQAVLAYRNSVTVLWLVSFWINLIPFENLPFTKLVAGCEVECMTVLFWDNSLTINCHRSFRLNEARPSRVIRRKWPPQASKQHLLIMVARQDRTWFFAAVVSALTAAQLWESRPHSYLDKHDTISFPSDKSRIAQGGGKECDITDHSTLLASKRDIFIIHLAEMQDHSKKSFYEITLRCFHIWSLKSVM